MSETKEVQGFDTEAFMKADLRVRQNGVPVPALKVFFPENEEPVWLVRGMTGTEMGIVNDVEDVANKITALSEALLSKGGKDNAISRMRDALGMGEETPRELKKRVKMLEIASVKPVINMQLAVRLAEKFPVEFYQITNEITRLTGVGADIQVKKQSSKESTESKQP